MIARLLGLCVLVLAAWPAGAELRAEGFGVSRLIAIPAEAPDFDHRDGRPPHGPTVAAGRADADEPEPIAPQEARTDPIPAQWITEGCQAREWSTPLSHRACAAPPTGPPAG
jgi:hypothetical protein